MTKEQAKEWLKAIEEKYIHGGDECFDAKRKEAISMAIKALSSVTPTEKVSRSEKPNKWIPVSERLPEDGTYLVTVGGMVGESSIDMKSFAKDLNRVDEYDFWNKQGKAGWYDYDSEYGYWEDTRVIAWMPLPKPYEPQGSEE